MKTRILIVDDSLIFRKALEEGLSGEPDIEVIGSVRNGLKALEFIRERRPDLVTLDVAMPDMDGLETLAAIQAANREAPDRPPIGVSTGGPKALATLAPALCNALCIPIFIVQHMPAGFTRSLAASLDNKCRYTVVEATHNRPVEDRHVYIAPGDRHLLIRPQGDGRVTVINRQPPESGSRPSADVLFRSAAAVFGSHLIALILTGMGSDGTQGAAAVKRAGGRVIAQDEATSVVWGMPGSAAAAGCVDGVLPLDRIPDAVVRLVNG